MYSGGLQDFQRENGEIAGVEGVRKGREGVWVASGRGAREKTAKRLARNIASHPEDHRKG